MTMHYLHGFSGTGTPGEAAADLPDNDPVRELVRAAVAARPLDEVLGLITLLERRPDGDRAAREVARAAAVGRSLDDVARLAARLAEPPAPPDRADEVIRTAAERRPLDDVSRLVALLHRPPHDRHAGEQAVRAAVGGRPVEELAELIARLSTAVRSADADGGERDLPDASVPVSGIHDTPGERKGAEEAEETGEGGVRPFPAREPHGAGPAAGHRSDGPGDGCFRDGDFRSGGLRAEGHPLDDRALGGRVDDQLVHSGTSGHHWDPMIEWAGDRAFPLLGVPSDGHRTDTRVLDVRTDDTHVLDHRMDDTHVLDIRTDDGHRFDEREAGGRPSGSAGVDGFDWLDDEWAVRTGAVYDERDHLAHEYGAVREGGRRSGKRERERPSGRRVHRPSRPSGPPRHSRPSPPAGRGRDSGPDRSPRAGRPAGTAHPGRTTRKPGGPPEWLRRMAALALLLCGIVHLPLRDGVPSTYAHGAPLGTATLCLLTGAVLVVRGGAPVLAAGALFPGLLALAHLTLGRLTLGRLGPATLTDVLATDSTAATFSAVLATLLALMALVGALSRERESEEDGPRAHPLTAPEDRPHDRMCA